MREDEPHPTTAQVEGIKLTCDFFKHLTTLSTGSIVILATFREKLAPQSHWLPLAAVAAGGFVLTVLGTVISHAILAFRAEQSKFDETKGVSAIVELITFSLAALAFFVALACLALFAIRNLWA